MLEALNLKPKDAFALDEFTRRVRATLGPDLVALRLFGSKVRGHGSPDSDIDVAVVVRQSASKIWDDVLDVAFKVNLAHDVYISPRVIEQRILEDPVWKITPFLQAVEREGVAL